MSNIILTRQQLAAFLKDERSIKAFEALVDAANAVSADQIASLQNQIDAINIALTGLTNSVTALNLLLEEATDIANGALVGVQGNLFQ